MKEELLLAIERLGKRLPPNTLDQLVDELGGTENVAEVSISSVHVQLPCWVTVLYTSRSFSALKSTLSSCVLRILIVTL